VVNLKKQSQSAGLSPGVLSEVEGSKENLSEKTKAANFARIAYVVYRMSSFIKKKSVLISVDSWLI
jgi:hypothetical protein